MLPLSCAHAPPRAAPVLRSRPPGAAYRLRSSRGAEFGGLCSFLCSLPLQRASGQPNCRSQSVQAGLPVVSFCNAAHTSTEVMKTFIQPLAPIQRSRLALTFSLSLLCLVPAYADDK